jgi:hypothetical protein
VAYNRTKQPIKLGDPTPFQLENQDAHQHEMSWTHLIKEMLEEIRRQIQLQIEP